MTIIANKSRLRRIAVPLGIIIKKWQPNEQTAILNTHFYVLTH